MTIAARVRWAGWGICRVASFAAIVGAYAALLPGGAMFLRLLN